MSTSILRLAFGAALLAASAISPAAAGLITVESGGISLNSTDTTNLGDSADPWLIDENATAPGTLKFAGGAAGGGPLDGTNPTGSPHAVGKWFSKIVTNSSGDNWTSFELELQVILGTPSLDGDGLSFAQSAGFTFTSDKFATVTAIEDIRDYLNFHDGLVGAGESVTFNFAITDTGENDPFYLLQTPNKREITVPEPGTLGLFSLALIGLGVARRRRKTA